MMCRVGSFVLYQTCYFLFSRTECVNLALQITSVLIDHSVSKCFVREQSKRLSCCRYFLQLVYMEYVLEAAGCLQLHNVSERMSFGEQEVYIL